MLKLLIDTIKRPLNTKKQSKGSHSYIYQKLYFVKDKKMTITY